MPGRLFIYVVIVVMLGVASAASQQGTAGTMTIDLLAVGSDGQPVTGLAPGEISVRAGGQALTVHGLEMLTIGDGAKTPGPARRESSLPPPFAETSTVPPSAAPFRNVLLLIDDGTLFGLEEILKNAVRELAASLGPRDRLGVATTRPGGLSVGLTTNHQAVIAAIDGMVLGRGNAFLCVGSLLSQITGLAQTLPSGRTSTLALVSRGAEAIGRPLGGGLSGAGNCQFRREDLTPVEVAVSAAQINYHVLHVGGGGKSSALDNLAGSTGAESAVLSWSDASGLARAVQTSSVFYRATIEAPQQPRRDPLRIEVRVTRAGVQVRAPQYLAVPLPPARALDAMALLRGEVFRSDLPLRMTAYASRNAGTLPVKLVVVAEPAAAGAKLLSGVVSVIGSDGTVVGQWTARPADLARRPLVTAVPVPEGRYRVRAALTDEGGSGGMAEYLVDGTLERAGPVTISDMALGIATQAGFTPRLVFDDEPEATAYLEVYDAPANAALSVAFELASSPDGPALGSFPGRITANDGAHMAIGALPLAQMPPGDTLVRARILVDGEEAAVVTRTLRKAAR